ncbi:hypothetical protein BST85_06745 [Aureitalea marina]|uniref:DUF1905 domain-containing protein n=2 Tax=Aureitalea marina TaxID=930804 RepID=A0A2S7KTV7_9FLAO|nr:hypothetical protein BST85_06745 [Aureitalea marina]
MHSLIIPDDLAVSMLDGGKKRVVVHGRYQEKEVEFHAALQRIKGSYRIMFSKKHQKSLGVGPTDPVEIRLSPDTSKYGVEVPEEFQAVLDSDPVAYAQFESLSDGLKRSLIYYVKRFKNSQTRIDKSLVIANNLALGISNGKELVVDRR